MKRGLIAFALLAFGTTDACAHDQSFSHVQVALRAGGADVKLTVHRRDAAAALGLASPDSLSTAGGIARHEPALRETLCPRLVVQADGRVRPITWKAASLDAERRSVELSGDASWARPPGRLAVSARLFPDNSLHETFLDVYDRGRLLRQAVLTESQPALETFTAGPAGLWAVIVTFVRAGVHHIFIGPDHILFIIGLLLVGGALKRILAITSGFTLAHSITLALATLGLVQPPARIVEPLIALSIVYVGLDNLRAHARGNRVRDGRAIVAFAFGLVHGFGFASVLAQLGLPRGALGASLFAFNVGVEIGQAAIVLTALPLIAWLRRASPRVAPRAVALASWGVVLAGGWWFVERVWLGG